MPAGGTEPDPGRSLARELRAIHSAFRQLARSFSRIAPLLGRGGMAMATVQEVRRPRRMPRLTAAHRAALKLQGQYMGTTRGLPAAKRAKVKRIRAAKGIRAAIKAAERMAG